MKKLPVLVLLASAVLIGGDVKGIWKGQVNRPDGTREESVVLQLTQDGDAISGKVGAHSDDMMPIRNAKLDGSKLMFEVAAHEATFTVTLDVDGDSAKGGVIRTRDGQSDPPLQIELKRAKE